MLQDLGKWDEFLELAEHVLAEEQRRGSDLNRASISNRRALILVRRGNADEAELLADDFLEQARRVGDAQTLEPALLAAALTAAARGDERRALDLAAEFEAELDRSAFGRDVHVPDWARITTGAGDHALAERLVERTPETFARLRHAVRSGRAIIAEGRRDHETAAELYREAARAWTAYGNVYEQGQALLGVARCRLASGDAHTAAAEQARTIFAQIGVPPLVVEADALLGRQPAGARVAK
jgi:ATP/maltotriose-dependent transcriptional regulator MalT